MQKFNVIVDGAQFSGMTLDELVGKSAEAAKAALRQYANAAQDRKLAAGVVINVAASGSPVNIAASMDPTGLAFVNGLATWAAANPGGNTAWIDDQGATTPLTAAQCVTLANGVMAAVQASFATLATVMAGVASGATTTPGQIDAAFA